MNPSFEVPAQYFYALAPNLPQDVSADVRYRMACLADEKQIVDQLRKAIDAGIISADSDVTPEMAARRLRTLGSAQGPKPICASGVGLALVQAYANYKTTPPKDDTNKDIAPFWASVMGNPALAAAHLEIALCAVTQEPDSRPLIADVNGQSRGLRAR